jgi:hypothetical protein
MTRLRRNIARSFFVTIVLVILASGALIGFKRYSPQRMISKINEAAPEILNKLTRDVSFEIEPSTAVASAQDAITQPLTAVRASAATGPLRVNPANPRYFTDSTGKAIYLTGSHTWSNLQDNGGSNPPAAFNYDAYLDFLQQNNHNFFRLWVWEQSRWTVETGDNNYWFTPMPYQRTGPGNALDGQSKFDLTKFNQAYFDRLRARVIAARDRGIYVSIMLFDGWSIEDAKGGFGSNNPWLGHPFNKSNNINSINGDLNGNDSGEETHTLDNPSVTSLQDAYVKKVIDTVNDLDNVLFEVSNESHDASGEWQNHMISLIHQYEAGKPKQHPVGITAMWPGGDNSDLFTSSAEWVSPNDGNEGFFSDPPSANGTKVILSDTDHLCGVCGDRAWVWKSFTRGENPIFMDGYDGAGYGVGGEGFDTNDPTWVSARKNMGYTLTYANRMNLAAMKPLPNLASSGYILANPNGGKSEYLVYLPSGGSVIVNLSGASGNLASEWLNLENGNVTTGSVTTGGGNRTLTAPFNGDAVLYLYSISSPAVESKIYLPAVAKESPPPTTNFVETFDGTPGDPTAWSSPDWDTQVHSRDDDTWFKMESMEAGHSSHCDPPPTTHPLTGEYADGVFQCRDHVMTAVNASGYGVIYLTPNQMINFSAGEAVLKFDVSTLRTSGRDWIDVWVTPFKDNLALPLDNEVDLMGVPKNSVHIRMDFGDEGIFKGEVYRNFIATTLPVVSSLGYEQVLTPSASVRSTFELHITRTHIKFGMPKSNFWWIDTDISDLGWSTGVVQLGHHSYNPKKDCDNSNLVCLPNTWHWDNVSINPATPFTMIKADKRYVSKDDADPTVTFNSPAPANSFLRFSGIGTIEVSFNGSAFQKAVKAQSSDLPGIGDYHPEHMSNYWMAVPQGTQTVTFRFSDDSWYTTGLPMIAKDFAIWH